MNELDMSRPSSELFAEPAESNYNSYTDVQQGHVVDDPLSMGVKQESYDVASQAKEMSPKEMNFVALREEVAKMQSEREYWKGQAEAYAKQATQQPQSQQSDALNALDWDDSKDVRKAFESMRQENDRLRQEFRDQVAAIETKASHQDWNTMVTQHVPNLTATNPIFAEMIQKASNPYEAAYQLAQLNARASQTATQPRPNMNGQRAMQNAAKPRTLESVGGSSTLNAADYYANMSDKDFMEIAAKNMANI